MVFPDKHSFYTARNVNSDFITEREEDLSLLKENPLQSYLDPTELLPIVG